MHVVGVVVGEDDRVEIAAARVDELLAHVRAGVDQDAGAALGADALHQQGAAAPPVQRVRRVAGAPVRPLRPDARHAARGAGAEDGEAQRVGHQAPAPAALAKRRSKFSEVAAQNSS